MEIIWCRFLYRSVFVLRDCAFFFVIVICSGTESNHIVFTYYLLWFKGDPLCIQKVSSLYFSSVFTTLFWFFPFCLFCRDRFEACSDSQDFGNSVWLHNEVSIDETCYFLDFPYSTSFLCISFSEITSFCCENGSNLLFVGKVKVEYSVCGSTCTECDSVQYI